MNEHLNSNVNRWEVVRFDPNQSTKNFKETFANIIINVRSHLKRAKLTVTYLDLLAWSGRDRRS